MKKIKTLFFILNFITILTLSSQNVHDFGFKRSFDIPIFENATVSLKNAWGGGMNSVRMSQIDLNGDGLKDLFVFEKNGNRILTYINCGIENEISYRYAPEYKHYFPYLHDWVILKDYNGDGKEDIFTYGLAGIRVYKNVSDSTPKFELVTEQLVSYYYNGYTNIFSSPDDYIAIEDIDGDGDLDILNFMVLGKYVHYQKNYAIENHGTTDIFDFHLEDECWGRFAEGEDDNSIELDCDCGRYEREHTRHVGSTLFAYDFTENGLKDLILGDIDYPTIVFLENGGTLESAYMVSETFDFPNSVQPIYLYSMPVVTMFDVSNDEIPEIIASPSDPSLYKSQDHNSVWLYQKNQETDEYELRTCSFLQDEMIDVGSGAYPVLYDWNGDGLKDLFIANYGSYDSSSFENYYLSSYYASSISYYENIGNDTAPVFQLITDDFANLKDLSYKALYPIFDDFNGDGKIDILCGNESGNLLFFLNTAPSGLLPIVEPPTIFENINVGNFSTPQYFDLDKDGKKDLLIGNRRGHIAFYKNVSTNDIPTFELVTSELGGVDVRDYTISYFGFSTPFFFRDSADNTLLFCGNEQGKIAYYKNIDANVNGDFELIEEKIFEVFDNNRYDIREGYRVGICVDDINNDGYPDLFVGNYAGGVSYFAGISPPNITIGIKSPTPSASCIVYPNPADNFFTIYTNIDKVKKIEIFSLTGKKMDYFDMPTCPLQINCTHYPSGIYFIQFTNQKNETFVEKVIIIHFAK